MTEKSERSVRPVIFDYLDFREYLRDLAAYLKAAEGFRLETFAKKAGLKSPGFLKMIVDGVRRMTPETTKGFARAFGLTGKERLFFLELVTYGQSEDPDEKKKAHERLIKLTPRSATYASEKKYDRYFSAPHYVTIREMVMLPDFIEDDWWIAKRCFPKISPDEARKAVAMLLELGLLRRNADGKLEQAGEFIKTEDAVRESVAIYHYHEAALDRARKALGVFPQEERSYYALTLPLTKELFREIEKEFYEFRDRMAAKVEQSAPKGFSDVYQIGFHMFPVTKKD